MPIPHPGKVARFIYAFWMKAQWNRRARRNAENAVADFRPDWSDDKEAYYASGLDDVNKVLGLAGWPETKDWRLLEIGCGTGRMTRHLAERFREIAAVDVSEEMIRKAQGENGHLATVRFEAVSGVDLAGFADETFDAALSYIVFQHLPSKQLVYGYLKEVFRVLRPQGVFFFQARNDAIRRRPGTYYGDSVDIAEVEALARAAGRPVRIVEGAGSMYCYFAVGPKAPNSPGSPRE